MMIYRLPRRHTDMSQRFEKAATEGAGMSRKPEYVTKYEYKYVNSKSPTAAGTVHHENNCSMRAILKPLQSTVWIKVASVVELKDVKFCSGGEMGLFAF